MIGRFSGAIVILLSLTLISAICYIPSYAAGQGTGGQVSCQSALSWLPQSTREKVVDDFLGSGTLCSLASRLNDFASLYPPPFPGVKKYNLTSNNSPIIHYYWESVNGINNTKYQVLMLRFTYNSQIGFPIGGEVDYNVTIIGTQPKFKVSGSTTTGVDMQIINSTIFPKNQSYTLPVTIKATVAHLGRNVTSSGVP